MRSDPTHRNTFLRGNRGGLLVAAAALALAGPAAAAVKMNVNSASTSRGGTATICVDVQADGQVAGTQNDVIWDSSQCEVLSCAGTGSHGKSVTPGSPVSSGTTTSMKILVLSITDVKPIPSGPLYCCQVRAQQTCSIGIQGVLGATPSGDKVSGSGGVGVVTVSDSGRGDGGGGSGGGGAPSGPLSAVGGATGGQAPSGAPTGGGPAGGVAGGLVGQQQPPPAVVLPGGVPGEVPVEGAPAGAAPGAAAPAPGQQPAVVAQAPTPIGGFPPTPIGGFVPTPSGEETPAEAVPTSAEPAATTPASAGTPTTRPTLQRPTLRPTIAVKPAVAPAPEEKKGWFGCQVVSGGMADGSPFLIVGLLGVVALAIRRRK